MSQNPECGADTAAYVLGALTGDELTAFEQHLASCTVCQEDIESLQQVVNALPLTAPQHAVPRQLRRRVMAEVRADARAQIQAQPRRSFAFPRLRLAGTGGAASRVPTGNPGRGYRPGLVGAAAAAVLVLAVVLAVSFGANSNTTTKTGHATGEPANGAKVYSASVGSARVIVTNGHAELVVHHLTPLFASRTYEVWLKRDGSVVPAGVVFNVSGQGDQTVKIPGGMAQVSAVMVTNEPAGGDLQPTSKPVVVTDIA